MIVPAVNIVISYDADAMIAFQRTKDLGSFREYLNAQDEKVKADTLIFTNAPNSNFISLIHSFGGDGDNKMRVEIMDPQGLFESEMLDNNFASQLDIKDDPFQQTLDRLEREKAIQENELAKLSRDANLLRFDKSDRAKANLREISVQQTKTKDRLAAIETQIENNTFLNDEDALKAIKDQMKAYVGKMQRQVYITYGVGTNLQDWAPVQCFGKIINIDYNFNGQGVRTLTLYFSGQSIHPNLTQNGTSPLGVNFSKGLLCKGISDLQLFNKEALEEAVDRFMRRYNVPSSRKLEVAQGFRYSGSISSNLTPSFHWPIVEAIENFIRSATNRSENVLVLIPDLDHYLLEYIEEEIDAAISTWGEILSASLFGGEFTPESLGDLVGSYIGYTKALKSIGLGACEVDTGSDSNITTAIGANTYSYIEECDTIDELHNWFNRCNYRTVLQTEIAKKTFLEKLQEVGDAIQAKMADYAQDGENIPTTFMSQVEIITDFNMIQIMFEKGLISNNRQPVLLWGERGVIDKVLYGRIYESTAKAIAAEKDKDADEDTLSNASLASQEDLESYVNEKLTDYIHPLDRLRGIDSNYVRDIFDYYVPTSWVGPFGPQYNGANELDTLYPGDTNLQQAAIEKQKSNPLLASRLPLFTFGNKNPNILSVNFKLDSQYVAAMNMSTPIGKEAFGNVRGIIPEDFQPEAYRMFNGIKGLDLNDVDPQTKVPRGFEKLVEKYYDYDYVSGDDIENFEQWQEVFNQLDSDKYKNMSDRSFYNTWGGLNSKQKFVQFMWESFSQLYEEAFDPKPTMQKVTPSKDPSKKVLVNSVRVAQNISGAALKGSIQTVPMFALSTDRRVLNKSCVVHCVEPRIYNPNDQLENFRQNTTWFSGIYNMLGFKHEISTDSAKSTFYLARGNNGLAKPEETED